MTLETILEIVHVMLAQRKESQWSLGRQHSDGNSSQLLDLVLDAG